MRSPSGHVADICASACWSAAAALWPIATCFTAMVAVSAAPGWDEFRAAQDTFYAAIAGYAVEAAGVRQRLAELTPEEAAVLASGLDAMNAEMGAIQADGERIIARLNRGQAPRAAEVFQKPFEREALLAAAMRLARDPEPAEEREPAKPRVLGLLRG